MSAITVADSSHARWISVNIIRDEFTPKRLSF